MDSKDPGMESTRKGFRRESERHRDFEGGSKSTRHEEERDHDDKDEKTLLRMKKRRFKDDAKGREYECVLCNCIFYTVGQYNLHIQSFEHRKRVIEKRSNKARYFASGAKTHCAICNVFLNSEKQRNDHIGGMRHKQICFKLNVPPTSLKLSKDHTETLADTRLHGNKLMCKYCSVELNSMQQYEEHMKSKNHQLRKENKKVNHLKSIKKATKMLYAKTKKKRAQEQEAKEDEYKDRSDKEVSAEEDAPEDGSTKHEVPVKIKKETKPEGKGKAISKVLQKYGFDELDDLSLSGGKPALGKVIKDVRKAPKPPKPVPYMCDICQVFASSAFHLNEHLLTEEHRKKMHMLISGQNAKKTGNEVDTGQLTEQMQVDPGEKDTSKKPELYCDTCQLMLRSKALYDEHVHGKKHKFLAELKKDADGPSKRSEKHPRAPQKNIHCKTCQDTYDSQQSFDEHIKSKKHKFLSALKPSPQKAEKHSSKDLPTTKGPGPSRSKESPQRWQPSSSRALEPRKRQLSDSDEGHGEDPHDKKRRLQHPQRNITLESLMYERQQIQLELEKREKEIEKQRKLVERLQVEKQEEREKAILRQMIDECRQLIQERQRRTAEMEAGHTREMSRREKSPAARTCDLWNRSPPQDIRGSPTWLRVDAEKPGPSKHLKFDPHEEWEGRGKLVVDQRTFSHGENFGPTRVGESLGSREPPSEANPRVQSFWDRPVEQTRNLGHLQPNDLPLTQARTREPLLLNKPAEPFQPLLPQPVEKGDSRTWQSADRDWARQNEGLSLGFGCPPTGPPCWEGPTKPSTDSLVQSTGQKTLTFGSTWQTTSEETQQLNRNIVPVWEEPCKGPQESPHQLLQQPVQQQVREADRMLQSTSRESWQSTDVSALPLGPWNTAQKQQQQLGVQPARKGLLETPTLWQNQPTTVPQSGERLQEPPQPSISQPVMQEIHRISRTWENTNQNWQPNRNAEPLPTRPQEPSQTLQQEEPHSRAWLNDGEKWYPGTNIAPNSHGALQGPTEAVRSLPSQPVGQTPRSRMWYNSGKQRRPSANVVPIHISDNSCPQQNATPSVQCSDQPCTDQGASPQRAGSETDAHKGRIETIVSRHGPVSWHGTGRNDHKPKHIPSWQGQGRGEGLRAKELAVQPRKKPLLPLPILPGARVKQEPLDGQDGGSWVRSDAAPFLQSQMHSSKVESKNTESSPAAPSDAPQDRRQSWDRPWDSCSPREDVKMELCQAVGRDENLTKPYPPSLSGQGTEQSPSTRAVFGDVPAKQDSSRIEYRPNWDRSSPGQFRKDDSGGSSAPWGGRDDKNWHDSDRNLSKYLRGGPDWLKPDAGPSKGNDSRGDRGKPLFNWGAKDAGSQPSSSLWKEGSQENAAHIPGFDFV